MGGQRVAWLSFAASSEVKNTNCCCVRDLRVCTLNEPNEIENVRTKNKNKKVYLYLLRAWRLSFIIIKLFINLFMLALR